MKSTKNQKAKANSDSFPPSVGSMAAVSDGKGEGMWPVRSGRSRGVLLYALKECIRARASKNARIPFRSSSLTRILKESFERDGARLCVIACVAPNATDTEHTMETLKTVASIVGVDDQISEEKAHVVTSARRIENRQAPLPPKQWDHEHLRKFLAQKKMKVELSEKHDGRTLMKMSVSQMRAQLFVEDRDKELAQKLFDLLRKENDRVAEILRKERAILKKERKGL